METKNISMANLVIEMAIRIQVRVVFKEIATKIQVRMVFKEKMATENFLTSDLMTMGLAIEIKEEDSGIEISAIEKVGVREMVVGGKTLANN